MEKTKNIEKDLGGNKNVECDKDTLGNFYYKKSRLQQLKGFYYTYQKLSQTKAAEKMGLGVSTITTQIKSLEKDLGVVLFTKKGNKIVPTEKADMLYRMSIPIIHGADALFEKFLYESNESEDNYIKLACHSNIAYQILPNHIKTFTDLNPKVVFDLQIIPLQESYEKILNNELDFAIFPVDQNKRLFGGLKYIDFLENDVVLVVPKNHWLAQKSDDKITKEDIAKSNFVCMDKQLFCTHKSLDFLLNNPNHRNNLLFTNANWEIIKAMVKAGICTCGMSNRYIDDNDRKYMVTKKIKNVLPTFEFCIIIKKNCIVRNNAKNFLEFLKKDIFDV